MRKSVLFKILVGAFLIPITSLFLISKFNLFSYFDFIPVEYQYEAGLGSYMFIVDAIYETVIYFIEKSRTKVTLIFYKTKSEMNIGNKPTVICSDRNNGVATFNCHIKLEGNLKRLRKVEVVLPLPAWLTAQISQNELVVNNEANGIKWKFSGILPTTSKYQQNVECTSKISVIKNHSDYTLTCNACPEVVKRHFWDAWWINFETNEIIIQNKE